MRKNRIKESVSDRIFNAVILFIVILINAIYIFPLLFVVFASVSDPTFKPICLMNYGRLHKWKVVQISAM